MRNLHQFLLKYPTRKFAKGEIILLEGEVPSSAYVVKSGIVKSYSINNEGLERPVVFDREYDVFPIGWVFSRLRRTQYYYSAFVDSVVYCVPRNDYMEYLKSRPESLFDVFDYFVVRYLNFQMRINALEQSKATDKVTHTLHYLCLRHGREIAKDTVRIKLPLTQLDLANIMGLTRETTGIELKKLNKLGVVSYRRQNYVIHTNLLNEMIEEEYDQGRIIPSQSVKKMET